MINKKFLAFLALVPTSSVFAEALKINPENSHVLLPGEIVYLNTGSNMSLQISHKKISERFLDIGVNTAAQNIKVRFHEENNDIDFTTLDGHSFVVSLENLAHVPPNMDGRGY